MMMNMMNMMSLAKEPGLITEFNVLTIENKCMGSDEP